jgi:DNA repair protein RadC
MPPPAIASLRSAMARMPPFDHRDVTLGGAAIMTIRDWPAADRPREKLLATGGSSLSDSELLAVLLGTGTAGKSAVELARELIGRFGGLSRLMLACRSEAASAKGLGPARRARLLAALELTRRSLQEGLREADALSSPADVKAFLRLSLQGRDRECFVVLFLDAQHRVIVQEELFTGTLTQTPVYPREIARRALEHNAAAVILAHNHPSGVAEPSRADEQLTHTVRQTLATLDVKVLDHVVIGAAGAVSLAERGLL